MTGSYSSTKWLWMNWMVRADLPEPVQWTEGMGERVTGMLTTTTGDDEFVLSQGLCLETVSGRVAPRSGMAYSGHGTSHETQVEKGNEYTGRRGQRCR